VDQYVVVQNRFMARLARAAPHTVVHELGNPLYFLARLGVPGFGLGQTRLKKLAKRIGAIVVQGAASNFGAHVVDAVQESMHEPTSARSNPAIDHQLTEEQDTLTSQQGRALLRFLRRALPQAPANRTQQLCMSLVKMDLDLKALALAAQMNTVLLDRALSDDQYMCVNLRVGERLALVHAAQTITDEELAYEAEPIFKFKRAANVIRAGSVFARASSNDTNRNVFVTGAGFGVGAAGDGEHGRPAAELPPQVTDTPPRMHTRLPHAREQPAHRPDSHPWPPRPMTEWTRDDVYDWLADVGGMEDVAVQARAMGVDGGTLANFTDACWAELGVSSGKSPASQPQTVCIKSLCMGV